MFSSIPRKTQPAIAQVVGLANEQSLHQFLTQSPWQVQHLRNSRLFLFI
jgi:SRSO17 transposase